MPSHTTRLLRIFLSTFQTCIARHESNGIDIIIALIVNSINPLGKNRLDLVLQLKVSSRCFCEASGCDSPPLPMKCLQLAVNCPVSRELQTEDEITRASTLQSSNFDETTRPECDALVEKHFFFF